MSGPLPPFVLLPFPPWAGLRTIPLMTFSTTLCSAKLPRTVARAGGHVDMQVPGWEKTLGAGHLTNGTLAFQGAMRVRRLDDVANAAAAAARKTEKKQRLKKEKRKRTEKANAAAKNAKRGKHGPDSCAVTST